MISPKLIRLSKSAAKTTGFIAITSTAVCGWLLGTVFTFQHLTRPAKPDNGKPHAATLNGEPATAWSTVAEPNKGPAAHFPKDHWRYTTEGWQNIHHWSAKEPQTSALSVDQFHPLTFAALIVMVSVLAMVMTSSDDEVDRLLKRKSN